VSTVNNTGDTAHAAHTVQGTNATRDRYVHGGVDGAAGQRTPWAGRTAPQPPPTKLKTKRDPCKHMRPIGASTRDSNIRAERSNQCTALNGAIARSPSLSCSTSGRCICSSREGEWHIHRCWVSRDKRCWPAECILHAAPRHSAARLRARGHVSLHLGAGRCVEPGARGWTQNTNTHDDTHARRRSSRGSGRGPSRERVSCISRHESRGCDAYGHAPSQTRSVSVAAVTGRTGRQHVCRPNCPGPAVRMCKVTARNVRDGSKV